MNKNYTPLGEEKSISCVITKLLKKGFGVTQIAHEVDKSKTECEWIIENIPAKKDN